MTPEITLSETEDVRYLHFGTPWIQGAMRLRDPVALELDYVQHMMAWLLFLEASQPGFAMTQLGLGAAALTKFCYHHFPQARITAVELERSVINTAHLYFALPPPDARLKLVEADAAAFVADPTWHNSANVLQVDLYDQEARGPVHESVAFYKNCYAMLREPGVLVVNLFGQHPSLRRNLANLEAVFPKRLWIQPVISAGNCVVLAFKGPALNWQWHALEQRTAFLAEHFGLPARVWLNWLKASA